METPLGSVVEHGDGDAALHGNDGGGGDLAWRRSEEGWPVCRQRESMMPMEVFLRQAWGGGDDDCQLAHVLTNSA